MATAKYTKGKDGYYQAKVWDGTYTEASESESEPGGDDWDN